MANSIIPTMLTIKDTARRTGLAEYYIRKLIWNNEICFIQAGSKYLVNVDKLIEYLDRKQDESISAV